MIKVLNSNLKMIGVLNNIHECTEHKVLNSEYTLDFSCTAEKLKTELLYDETNIIECDDNYYKVFNFDELHETGGLVTFSCSAEHIGYEIIQEIFEDGFEMTGTVQEIGQAACSGTRFNFTSDIEGTYTVKLSGVTNARAVIDRLCILTSGEVKWNKFSIQLKQSIGQNTIYVEFGKNCSSVKRHVQRSPNKVSYTVDLIDCNDEETKELRKVHLGDTIIINDKVLHTENVSKKVVSIDIDKLANSANNITDQTVENFDRTIPSSTVCILGDKDTDIINEFIKNVEIPDVDPNILIEVVEQKVITSEVAMIQNCWINELSVNYLETNFDALDIRKPYVATRNFLRIYNEVCEHITQELSQTEVEDYKTPSGLQIYWTAINDSPQAYKYFTITHPREYNPDLTNEQAEAFKVKVRKVVKEYIKSSSNFEKFTDTDDVVPTMVFGSGHGDSSGDQVAAPAEHQIIKGRTIYRGQGMIYKSRKGLHTNYINANGKKHEVVVGENGIELGKCIFTEDDETLLTTNKKIPGAINEVFQCTTDAFNLFKKSILSKGGKVAEPVNKTNINNGILSIPQEGGGTSAGEITPLFNSTEELFAYYGWVDVRAIANSYTDFENKVICIFNTSSTSTGNPYTSTINVVRSDGYVGKGSPWPAWDTTKDLVDNFGNKYRWVMYSDIKFISSSDQSVLYMYIDQGTFTQSTFPLTKYYRLIMFDISDRFATALSKITNYENFCSYCYSLVKLPDNLDISNGTNFTYFCYFCYSLSKLPDNLNTSKGIYFNGFCENCTQLSALPENLDTSSGVQFNYFCNFCLNLTKLPDNLNTSKGLYFDGFLYDCHAIKKLPDNLDVSNGISFSNFCTNCFSLTEIPEQLKFSSATSLSGAFSSTRIRRIPPGLNTSNVTSFSGFCNYCRWLTDVTILDLSKTTGTPSMFSGCYMLPYDIVTKLKS